MQRGARINEEMSLEEERGLARGKRYLS
jgi:hypothetical protein